MDEPTRQFLENRPGHRREPAAWIVGSQPALHPLDGIGAVLVRRLDRPDTLWCFIPMAA